jgi:hypothetical protein
MTAVTTTETPPSTSADTTSMAQAVFREKNFSISKKLSLDESQTKSEVKKEKKDYTDDKYSKNTKK